MIPFTNPPGHMKRIYDNLLNLTVRDFLILQTELKDEEKCTIMIMVEPLIKLLGGKDEMLSISNRLNKKKGYLQC